MLTATRRLALAASLLSFAATSAPAAPAAAPAAAAAKGDASAPAAVDQALKHYYGDAKTHVFNSWEFNGTKVYDATVDNAAGQSTASVTENGDILSAGMPVARTALPPAVADVAEGLFQSPAKDVDQYTATYYFVNVQPAAAKSAGTAAPGTYELKFDATGKLLDVRSYNQSAHTGKAGDPVGANDPVRHNLAAAAQKDFAGATATDVHTFPNAPGHYVVTLRKNGQPGWVVMDQQGAFYASRIPVEQAQVPQPVQRALQADFKADAVKGVLRGDERLYRVEQSANGQKVVLHVHPNGDVIDVQGTKPAAK